MYEVPGEWENYQVDYRAVGMMVCYVLSQPPLEISEDDYHNMVSSGMVDPWRNDHQFIKTLLERGKMCIYVN